MNSDKNEEDIMNLLCSEENAQKTAVIINRTNEIKERLIDCFFISKLDKWAKRQEMEVMAPEKDWNFRYCPKGWQNHYIGMYKNCLQIKRFQGRHHRLIQLDCLSGKPESYWPFGWLDCSEYFKDFEMVTNGQSFEEVKKLIVSIINEIKQLSKSDEWTFVM